MYIVVRLIVSKLLYIFNIYDQQCDEDSVGSVQIDRTVSLQYLISVKEIVTEEYNLLETRGWSADLQSEETI